eukprot:m.251834 g.251834  ORF g.251834 m.251834 type:complete len:171 (-) comp19546_c0_seq2:1199-1711(-)
MPNAPTDPRLRFRGCRAGISTSCPSRDSRHDAIPVSHLHHHLRFDLIFRLNFPSLRSQVTQFCSKFSVLGAQRFDADVECFGKFGVDELFALLVDDEINTFVQCIYCVLFNIRNVLVIRPTFFKVWFSVCIHKHLHNNTCAILTAKSNSANTTTQRNINHATHQDDSGRP